MPWYSNSKTAFEKKVNAVKQIAIVTDSSAGLSRELVQAFDLSIVPIGVQINNKIYREGIDISKEQFYAQLEAAENVSTSQPSPGDFLEVYQHLAKRAKEIISIHVTSIGSGTVNTANLAKRSVSAPICVVDSKTASMAQGFMALAAAKAAQAGKTREEILEIVEYVRERTAIFVAVPTLKYLAKSGRVTSMQSMIAGVLSIKPILGVKDGMVDLMARVRSYPKALQRVISLIEDRFPQRELSTIAVLHSNALKEAEQFREQIQKRLRYTRIFVSEMSASLAVHGGRGMLGITAYDGLEELLGCTFPSR